jgi:hypothetical protein
VREADAITYSLWFIQRLPYTQLTARVVWISARQCFFFLLTQYTEKLKGSQSQIYALTPYSQRLAWNCLQTLPCRQGDQMCYLKDGAKMDDNFIFITNIKLYYGKGQLLLVHCLNVKQNINMKIIKNWFLYISCHTAGSGLKMLLPDTGWQDCLNVWPLCNNLLCNCCLKW